MSANELTEVVEQMPARRPKGVLSAVSRTRRVAVPSSDDPYVELRRLTKQHKAWTRKAVAIGHMSSDRKNLETGETIKCDLPDDVRAQMTLVVEALGRQTDKLESDMKRALKVVPIYQHFLSHVFGVGVVTASYLASEIDIHKATKPSNLRRFCGLAVIGGRLERRDGAPKCLGGTGTYNQELRTRLFQAFSAMWKKKGTNTSKYLDIWRNYLHRMEQSERVFNRGTDKEGGWTGSIENGQGKTVSARGFAFSTGWHKAADVLIEDLYIVWRALEGLPVWPDYYAAKVKGYEHGGKICVDKPMNLSLEEALEMVGYVGKREGSTAAAAE
jgi:hypothetical protein